ncbi:CDP-alcohol phosphatidyltransferase family protein [Brachybacterium saurashtrense]|uniref:CDP-alcohol phosphatidyltransferase family protein n=1 Tax=Brachybacterium saurashtrense TaxID=556288 RepID=A0A345YR64_9MICO|nr:CDP-alcohol phosphatidyltransferase family protein [Brachybacterium saurashtrense]AXK46416.1 CDP-alcohol phosphatidyltransferase family protein [Brachybacterium saurashtrense]RRR24157.1 CDP-alcohol phosphatidyltransferase family protein [Brachybacterium saurashtrense]
MAATSPVPAPPGRLRRVGTVLALLAGAQLLAGALVVLLAAPASALLGIGALLASLAPWVVAAATLGARRPGPVTAADGLTLLRHLGTAAIAASAVLTLGGELSARSWPLALLCGAALASDAVDGPVARRTGTAGPVGARIDMEADAALVLVLSVLAATVVAPWALAIGLMRYVYVGASFLRPALRRPLAFSQFRRLVGGFQGVALLSALLPVVPASAAAAVVATALVLLVISFGRDVLGQERAQRAGVV